MAIWDTSGKIVRYQGTLLDITARREMEQRLQKEQEFRQRLVESFPDVIVALDTSGNYTYASARVKEVLGYPPEFFVGRQFGEVIAPDDMPEMKRLFRALVTGEQRLVTYEYSARHQDGTTRLLRASASPMYDASGAIAGVIASVRDITEQLRMQRQLVQSERMAAMGQMVDGFAHELNNPLTAVLAACEMLRSRNSHGLPAKELDLLHQQAKRAAEVVQNLLFFSRPPAPGTARLDLNELVQRTLKLQTYSLKVNHISVDFLPQPDVPAVTGDPNQLMQVFLNLIINAEQAIRHARERGTLRVRVGKDDSSAWVSFQDDGPGLTPEAAQKVFDPFYSTKRPGGGQGLGLSICRTILQQHGGDIEAAPAPGGGAVFTVRIPLAGATEPDRAATRVAS
jgi:PAS domain S-box-containing protein